jgi:hypothetical protein
MDEHLDIRNACRECQAVTRSPKDSGAQSTTPSPKSNECISAHQRRGACRFKALIVQQSPADFPPPKCPKQSPGLNQMGNILLPSFIIMTGNALTILARPEPADFACLL